VKAYADILSEFEQKTKLVLRSKQILGQVYYEFLKLLPILLIIADYFKKVKPILVV
jgi:hypothetical protein